MGFVLVRPHSEEQSALEATENTLKALIGGGPFERDASCAYVSRDGWYRVECVNPNFVVYAVVAQGYVRDAKIETGHG